MARYVQIWILIHIPCFIFWTTTVAFSTFSLKKGMEHTPLVRNRLHGVCRLPLSQATKGFWEHRIVTWRSCFLDRLNASRSLSLLKVLRVQQLLSAIKHQHWLVQVGFLFSHVFVLQWVLYIFVAHFVDWWVCAVEPGQDDQFLMFVVDGTPSPTSTTVSPSPALTLWQHDPVNSPIYDSTWMELLQGSGPDVINGNILEDLFARREVWITERTQVLSNPWTKSGDRPLPMLGSRASPFGEKYEDSVTEKIIQ